MFAKIIKCLEKGLEQKVYPGAVLIVARDSEVLFFYNIGHSSVIPRLLPMEKDTIFDLASLTKPLATTLAVMKLVDDGMLDLDVSISSIIQPFPWRDKAGITPRLLLNHSSGLADWKPFHLNLINLPPEERKHTVRRLIMEEPLLSSEPQSVSLYSDLGFMLLEWIIERASGQDLSSFLNAALYRPLGLQSLYLDAVDREPAYPRDSYAATEDCPWRKEIMQGHVHDENAYALGGHSGHAGLFGMASDVLTLATMVLNAYHGEGTALFTRKTARTFLSRQGLVPDSTWALGWDTPSERGSSSGNLFSSSSIGHTGFTGTSVWIDLERRVAVVFLTNRVHPTRSNEAIKDFRPELHNLIMRELGYANALLH
jgi:CubicO group peptidase (beta-lactamase class C family)